jgi:hypothetical protein
MKALQLFISPGVNNFDFDGKYASQVRRNMKYDAITVDTNIFSQNGYHLEGGLLAQLHQFKYGAKHFVISEVVLKEIMRHMKEGARHQQDSLIGSLRKAIEHGVAPDDAVSFLEAIKKSPSPSDAAKLRIAKFMENCGAYPVQAKLVNVDELLKRYFAPLPPFESAGKKKAEFPDAIALLSLEEWAKQNEMQILAISCDTGWEDFAKSSNHIDVIKDLASALQILQEDTDVAFEIIRKIVGSIRSGAAGSLESELLVALSDSAKNVGWYGVASSWHGVDIDDVEVSLSDFKILDESEHEIGIVYAGTSNITAIVGARISGEATAGATFHVWDSVDREYVYLGSSGVSTAVDMDVELLISFNISGGGNDGVAFTGCEIVSRDLAVDFGDIEPDFSEGNEDDFDYMEEK